MYTLVHEYAETAVRQSNAKNTKLLLHEFNAAGDLIRKFQIAIHKNIHRRALIHRDHRPHVDKAAEYLLGGSSHIGDGLLNGRAGRVARLRLAAIRILAGGGISCARDSLSACRQADRKGGSEQCTAENLEIAVIDIAFNA